MTNPLYTHFWPALLATTIFVFVLIMIMLALIDQQWPLDAPDELESDSNLFDLDLDEVEDAVEGFLMAGGVHG